MRKDRSKINNIFQYETSAILFRPFGFIAPKL